MPTPFDQSRYQVRLEWGLDGLERLAPSDIVVVVDVLRVATDAAVRLAAGAAEVLVEANAAGPADGSAIAVRAGERADTLVLLGALVNATAVADAVIAEQVRRGGRTSVTVLAAGAHGDGGMRFTVEDLFGAGAVIDGLAARGIDHTAPEAAAASEAFRGLRGAVRHLLTAAGSGQELLEQGERDEVLAAAQLDTVPVVPVLRGGVFVPFA